MDLLIWLLIAAIPLVLVFGGLVRESRRERILNRLGIPTGPPSAPVPVAPVTSDWELRLATIFRATGLDALGRVLQAQLTKAGYRSPAAPGTLALMQLVVMGLAVYLVCYETRLRPVHRPVVGFATAMMVWMAFMYVLLQMAGKRQLAIQRHIPFWLDLHTTLVEGGLGFDAALALIVQETRGTREPLFEELERLSADLLVGQPRIPAYRSFAERGTVAELHQVVAAIIQAQQLGTGMADTLRAQADMMRNKIWEEANRRAEQLPVKLLFPTAFGVLPSMFVVTAVPGMLNLVHFLRR